MINKDIKREILELKEEKNALILAHYYVPSEVQELADYIGDSYGLSKEVLKSSAKNIVFCGVKFMGESAKLLNPEKNVYLVDSEALCPMADMVTKDQIDGVRSQYEDLAVVSYINSTAEIKRYSDVCITSSNAVEIIRALPEKNIYLIPDKNLGSYIKLKVPEKNIILHDGYCYVHDDMSFEMVREAKKEHPNAKVLVHPECNPEIFSLADYIGSTSGILKYVGIAEDREFIICTEQGILYKLKGENPEKRFYWTSNRPVCSDMKKVTLKKLLGVLKHGENEVVLDERLVEEARKPLLKMMNFDKKEVLV